MVDGWIGDSLILNLTELNSKVAIHIQLLLILALIQLLKNQNAPLLDSVMSQLIHQLPLKKLSINNQYQLPLKPINLSSNYINPELWIALHAELNSTMVSLLLDMELLLERIIGSWKTHGQLLGEMKVISGLPILLELVLVESTLKLLTLMLDLFEISIILFIYLRLCNV